MELGSLWIVAEQRLLMLMPGNEKPTARVGFRFGLFRCLDLPGEAF